MKFIYLVIIASIILLALSFFKKQQQALTPAANKRPTLKNQEFEKMKKNQPISTDPVIAERQELAATRYALRMNASKMPVKGGAVQFSLLVKAKGRCGARGDFDVIEKEHEALPTNSIIMSIEFNGGTTLFSQAIQPEELKAGLVLPMGIKFSDRYKPLGVFICSDTTGKRSCQGKPIADLNALIEKHWFDGPEKVKGDKVYFYQFLGVRRDRVHHLSSNLLKEEQLAEGFTDYLSKISGSAKSAKSISNMQATLQSMPLVKEGETLQVNLPYWKGPECFPPEAQKYFQNQ